MSDDDRGTSLVSPRAMAASAGELNALLGRGTSFEGTLIFEGKVRIDGRLDGKVRAEGVLIVGEDAEVTADIDVDTLIVRGGTVRGEVTARAAIEVYAPGKVFANLTAPEVYIEKGVLFEGACKMTERGAL